MVFKQCGLWFAWDFFKVDGFGTLSGEGWGEGFNPSMNLPKG